MMMGHCTAREPEELFAKMGVMEPNTLLCAYASAGV